MPGSCGSDKNSSSLISTLRSFRFNSKAKTYQPPTENSTPDSTSLDNSFQSNEKSPSENQTAAKSPAVYSPLSYRKYEVASDPQTLLLCIKTKITDILAKTALNIVQLELKLTIEELKKVKEIVLQDPRISERWSSQTSEDRGSLPFEKILKVNRRYLRELVNLISLVIVNRASISNESAVRPSAKTYGKRVRKSLDGSQPAIKNLLQPTFIGASPVDTHQLAPKKTSNVMEQYEVFCSKESNLRKLLDAFPGADIMEAQDILVRCDWDLKQAMIVAHNQPLRCTSKRTLSTETLNSLSSTAPSTSGVAEEIVLDSSDDESFNIQRKPVNSKRLPNNNSITPAPKRVRRISSSESDGDDPPTTQKRSILMKQTMSNSLPNSNIKPFAMSTSMSIKPISGPSSSSSKIGKPAEMPNLPKGLMIVQIPSESDSEGAKPLSNGRQTKSDDSSPEIKTKSSNCKSAQVVRVVPANNKNNVTQYTLPSNNSINITPVSKGVSITPVMNAAAKLDMSSGGDDSLTAKKSKSKSKRKKYSLEEDEDEDYGNEGLIYDSEDSDYEENTLTAAHGAVLKYFVESSPEELGCIPGCSKKKVDAVINARPFNSWAELVEKLSTDKFLSTDLLNGAKKVLDMRSAINKLMSKCQQISLEMEDLVENLKENKESSSGYISKQPELLNLSMHLTSYQMLGLNWLYVMHNQEVNGILADEMGLGKTVQAIAFLAYLKEVSISGPHLIVVPSSVMDNWKQELNTWWPDVSVICYHGSQDVRRELRMQILNDEVEEFDVMITTYNMVTSSAEDRGFFKRLEFHYVVFDEAHMLKNMASQRYQHLMRIKAPRRLLLTGTPLQNNLVELMSLLIFAMPHMFSGKTDHIKQMFTSVSKTEGNKNSYEKDRIEHAKRIMKPFVLRRLKKDVLQDLPPKHDEIRHCSMTEDQTKKYDDLVEALSAEVRRSEEKDAMSCSGSGMMMQLRRAANHPLLLRKFYNDDLLQKMSKAILKEPTHCLSDPKLVFEDMAVMHDFELHRLSKQYKSLKSYVLKDEDILNSGKFKVLQELLPKMIDEGHRILLFSQFTMVLDIIQEYMNLKTYKFLRLDGQVPVHERQQLIDDFNKDSTIFVFLLSTRAGGLGINLTAADTVILHDIDFNPYNDKQAEDRCHRVGQTRDVTVLRLVSKNTIEEGILQRATEKLKLERDIHEVNESENEENDVASVAKLLRDALGLKNSKS